jgi:hypothetical protein
MDKTIDMKLTSVCKDLSEEHQRLILGIVKNDLATELREPTDQQISAGMYEYYGAVNNDGDHLVYKVYVDLSDEKLVAVVSILSCSVIIGDSLYLMSDRMFTAEEFCPVSIVNL